MASPGPPASGEMSLYPNMQVALDEAGKVVKKQKTCAAKTDALLGQLISVVQASQKQLSSGVASSGQCSAIKEFNLKVGNLNLIKELNTQTKEVHTAIGKLGKALDKAFNNEADLCKTLRPVYLEREALNQIIAEHFYREGRFQLGDLFAQEAGIATATAALLKQPYLAMHDILQEIHSHELSGALAWAEVQRPRLSPSGAPSAFEFQLHAMQFLHTLSTTGQSAALAYARKHFPAFQAAHMCDIQRLMGAMLFHARPAGKNPYAAMLASSGLSWERVAQEFARQACSVLGQAAQSPLTVAVAAGAIALPTLLKLAALFEKKQLATDLHTCEQLPVEIELGPEFVFHSIFACPVSRDQSTAENPPVLLPCNHVLCEQSVLKIAKSRTRMFKCPYCPTEARPDNLTRLSFPDVP